MQDSSPAPEAAPAVLPDVFEQAAAEARERIRRDARLFAGDEEATAFLDHLADHVFEADLDVVGLRKASGASRGTYDRIRAKIGALKAYIDEVRIAAARKLVVETDADFGKIGRKVGFDVSRTFRRTFLRLVGQSPRQLRRDPEGAPRVETPRNEAQEEAPEPAPEEAFGPRLRAARWRRRLALGLCDRQQAARLRGMLRQRYTCLRSEETPDGADGAPALPPWVRRPVRFLATDEKLGWFAAAAVVDRLLGLPDPDLRHAFVHGMRFGHLSGFYLLHQVSLGMLYRDVEKAVRIAELAVEMAEAHPEEKADDRADWRALAWAGLGRVRLEAGDRAGADLALTFARAEWEAPREKTLPVVGIQVCRVEAQMRKVQRRYDEAADLLDHAIEVGRQQDQQADQRAIAFECLVERAEIARIVGDGTTAVGILRELLRAAAADEVPMRDGDGQEEMCRAVLLFCLAKALVVARDYAEAEERFGAARELCGEGLEYLRADVDQEEARLCLRTERPEAAERLLRSSCDGFGKLDQVIRHGVAAAELAGVGAYLGRGEEARATTERAASFLEWLPLHREARRAARLLRSMTEAHEVPLSAVEELIRCLDFVAREAPYTPWGSEDAEAMPCVGAEETATEEDRA